MLRLSRSGASLDPAAYFLDGGALFRLETVDALVQNPDELLATIRESLYGDRLSGMLAAVEAGASLIPAEHAVEAALLATADSLGYENPLSITPVLSFILAKRREVDNVRAIARGREAGLDVETLESEVVIV
jgi:Archaeal/vacuolar-type H+-ATPase subunit C